MKKQLGIYVHLPFCVKKCGYCDFYSVGADEEMKKAYVRALITEIKREKEEVYNDFEVKTIYFGGGTPSVLAASLIREILVVIKETFCISKEEGFPEITIECNPATVDEEKLAIYREAGINRLSLGLQSANNNELRLLGRIHTYEEFLESYTLVREAGFQNVNVDLMSGLPTQTMESFSQSVKEIVRLNPEHISSYSLIIEEGTPFFKKYSEGKKMAKLLPDEALERDLYYYTNYALSEAGYHRYEISNYAKKGFESKHNSSYWERLPYLGFGVAAASQFDKKRWTNIANLKEYIKRMEEGSSVRLEVMDLSEKNEIEESLFLGLRLIKGLNKEVFLKKFGKDIYEVYPFVLKKYINQGFLEDEKGFIKLTEAGIDVSNQILSEFLLD